MSDWPAVRLTQARQVAILMDTAEDDLPDADIDVASGYAVLRQAGDRAAALDYIAHALPRLEAVAWAAWILDEQSRERIIPVRDRLALDHALRWLDDPSDANRRATYAAATLASDRSAEHHLGFAIFYSGGSIVDAGMASVLPPPEACLRYAVAAVKRAA